MTQDARVPRIAYVPCSASCAAPGDRRRFAGWAARREVPIQVGTDSSDVDLVVLSAVADVSRWARRSRDDVPIVYDLVDSYLAIRAWRPDDIARGLGKSVLRQHRYVTPSYNRAVAAMCRRADIVVCSTDEQASTIRDYCSDVRVILDLHEQEFMALPRRNEEPGELRLFWEGQPQNLAGFLPVVAGALAELSPEVHLVLHVATDPSYRRWFNRVGRVDTQRLLDRLPVPTRLHEWEATSLAELAAECDLGVIPLDLEDSFAVGKPENKLLIMWRLGLPVITSATPSYDRTMHAAGLDLTCRTRADWLSALRRMLDPDERARAAALGRAYVTTVHTDAKLLAKWDRLVNDALASRD